MDTTALPLVLRPDIYARVQEQAGLFLARGYRLVTRHKQYRALTPVNARSHQYPGARERGIGIILTLAWAENSAWEQKHQVPDVEAVILRWDGTLSVLGYHHLEPVTGTIA